MIRMLNLLYLSILAHYHKKQIIEQVIIMIKTSIKWEFLKLKAIKKSPTY